MFLIPYNIKIEPALEILRKKLTSGQAKHAHVGFVKRAYKTSVLPKQNHYFIYHQCSYNLIKL